jgi:nitrate reductase NapA
VTFLSDYRPEHIQEAGLPADSIRWLASQYGDPQRRVMSVWGRNLNQDVRGTWNNNALYNLHLLVGKIATPGNAALGLTGQPSGGSAPHDAGSLTQTLPRGSVQHEVDRRRAAEIWGVPAERLDPSRTAPTLSMFRRLEKGEIRFLWIQATDPMVSLPNLDRYRRAATQPDRFLVVSEAYPTPTTDVADVVLPAAMWFEREGIYANVERRFQHFEQIVAPPGDATSDAWQMIEVGRRLGFAQLFPYEPRRYVAQIWEEYTRFHTTPGALPPTRRCAPRPVQWPYAAGRGTRWRYNATGDPAADGARGRLTSMATRTSGVIWLRPHEPPAEKPDGVPVLALHRWCSNIGDRLADSADSCLHRALPHAYVEMNREDARELGIGNRERIRLVSRRGSLDLEARLDYRSQPPRGQVFVPSFDEAAPINRLMLDAYCPLSGQPDGSKCAVRVERLAAGAP